MTIKFKNIPNDELQKYAMDKLGYTQMTENLIKSFNGSIGKAIIQKENQEKFLKIENLVDELMTDDIITIMNNSKLIYDKEKIYIILEYMIVCVYEKSKENKAYINCVEKINEAIFRLKRNCNFDMTIDSMIFDIYDCVQKGI